MEKKGEEGREPCRHRTPSRPARRCVLLQPSPASSSRRGMCRTRKTELLLCVVAVVVTALAVDASRGRLWVVTSSASTLLLLRHAVVCCPTFSNTHFLHADISLWGHYNLDVAASELCRVTGSLPPHCGSTSV
ncbi:uncharacterized protein LOC110264279 [Arachis ipaensis]|uniref:uncharacterized protein LOC110264279 n=1 Tax=Arachis ipaensis TaxID=130454 RepID=UPI000A2B0D48|nr:uncharacterized protein LOC110264279 [Arachis ipaensis]QHN93073.1 uncharacterized protein DS421_17g589550 [Arachis hypogaea]